MRSILKSIGKGIGLFLGIGRADRVTFTNARGDRESGVILKRIGDKRLRVHGKQSGRVKLHIKDNAVVFE